MLKKILIVDDDNINRKLIARIIGKQGYEYVEAENGVEALDALKKQPVDMILLDLMMPIMNGFEFLEKIKQTEYKDIPIIVLTTDDSKKNDSILRGANDFITKPVKPVDLIEKLQTF